MSTYNSQNWDEWARKTLEGDKSAYRRLLGELQQWLTAYYTNRIHPAAVDDLVQEALIAFHTKKETYEPSRPFGPWIAAVARYKWIDYMRKNLKHIELEIDDNLTGADDTSGLYARHDVERLLRHVPKEQAKVIDMVKIKQMTVAETAKKTGHSVSSVKVMIHRGLKTMRGVLEKDLAE